MSELFNEAFAAGYQKVLATTIAFEAANTQKVLAAVKSGDWRPDPKARTAREISEHIVTGDAWFYRSALAGAFAMPGDAPKLPTEAAALAAYYGEQMKAVVDELSAREPKSLLAEVEFFGQKLSVLALFDIALRHSIHHRGQLDVYLRPLGGRAPALYGGSADEKN